MMPEENRQRRHADYLDFELEIGLGRGREYEVAVLDSPAGEARATMRFPLDDLELENRLLALQNALLRSGGTPRRALSPEQQAVQDFGRELFEALFTSEVRSCYDVSLRAARQWKGLRLKLRILPPELASLPWEYLWHPGQAEYVSLSTRTPIVRYLEVPQRIGPLAVRPPLRILAMIASPSDLHKLHPDREKQRIERALRDLAARNLVELTWLAGQSWRDLLRAMRHGPWHIFHFIGHGDFDQNTGEGLIVLTNQEGKATRFSATRLSRILRDHDALRLVLLNSCKGAKGSGVDIFSSTASILVRQGIPAVVAMQYEITDQAAIEFARTFYEAVGDGMPVDGAVAEARKAIDCAVSNSVEWGTPVLYMRSIDGVLFKMEELERGERSARSVDDLPAGPPEGDEELEQRLADLYTDGLAAFFSGKWDQVCRSFQPIVEVQPEYKSGSVAIKLKEAERQQRLQSLYDKAQTARGAKKWEIAIAALEELVAEPFDYRDAAALLEVSKRQKKLSDLYSEAQHLYQAGKWQAVVGVFAQIAALDPDYPDPDDLLSTAEREVAEQERQAELKDLRRRALQEMDAGRWLDARKLLTQLQEMEPDYSGLQPLLERAEAEISHQEEVRRRQEKVDVLYSQACDQAVAQEWQQVLDLMQEVHRIDPQFADPEGIAARAQEEVACQRRLEDLYTEARAAREAGDWQRAIAALEALTSEAAGYRDAAELLDEAKRQKQLAGLYAEAQQHHHAGEWLAVVGAFEQIAAIEPEYADPEGLLPTARQEIEAHERRMEAEDLYGHAVAAIDGGHWPEAERLLLQVQEREPGYRDAEQLLASAKAEIERAEAERQRQEKLYLDGLRAFRLEQWDKAVRCLQAVVDTRPDYQGGDAAAKLEEARRWGRLQALYAQALEHLEARRWHDAIEGFGAIVEVDRDYSHALHGSAAALLTKALQEKERAVLPSPPTGRQPKPTELPEETKLRSKAKFEPEEEKDKLPSPPVVRRPRPTKLPKEVELRDESEDPPA
jgi:outer membrane protein assembly factor BamD (BamD/ComL family)